MLYYLIVVSEPVIKPSPLPVAVHCGYVFFLSLVLWAELAARVLPKDPDMQSIVEDLEAALMTYSSVLQTKVRRNALQVSHQTPFKKQTV